MFSVNEDTKVFSVSRLTEEIRNTLEGRFDFIWVEGEVSNFSSPVSGHYYMVLKDEKAQIRGVMFRLQARYLKFVPENGMKVLASGRIGIYPPRGEYQIILDYLEPLGIGALALAFEQLKKKLAAQGVFDEAIKKPLPFLPKRVAVITSPTGAAIRDFLKVIHRRFVNVEIVIVPVRVQGNEAAADMVKALDMVNRELNSDVIVLTRGGGSLEDLWAFNQEELAMAIRASDIPVVSAVGHEIDLTISDLASDFRAPTPSSAAEFLVVEKKSLINRLHELRDRLETGIIQHQKNLRLKLGHLAKGLRDPGKHLADTWMRLDENHLRIIRLILHTLQGERKRLLSEKRSLLIQSPVKILSSTRQRLDFDRISLIQAMNGTLGDKQIGLSFLEKRLKGLSPTSILNRGYSITRKLPGKIFFKNALDVQKGDHVQVLLAKGELECIIEKTDCKEG